MKQTLPLDEATYLAVQASLTRARRGGWDAAEVLHEAGLVLSPAVRRRVVVAELEAFARELERWRPHEFLRRVHKDMPSTPADMHEAICSYLADYIDVRRRS
mgnify:CR=1 FL=1